MCCGSLDCEFEFWTDEEICELANLEQPHRAHAAADAHGGDDVFRATSFAFDQRMADHACAGHAVGMANRNRAAVDVQSVVRNAEAIAAIGPVMAGIELLAGNSWKSAE